MKTRFLMGEMIQYMPAALKDAIHHASKEAGQDTDKLELHRRAHSEKAQINQIDPTFRKSLKYVSARTQDRDDEIVVPNGISLTDFMKYGSVLVNHNYSLMPIGSDEKIWADDFGIKALTVHADTGEGTLANVVWHLVSQGHMKASSIGFVPVETTKPGKRDWDSVANKLQREWKEFDKAAAEKSVSRIITKGVLLEHSFVSVPCNVDAEVEQIIKGMGLKDEAVFKGLGWKAEKAGDILVPRREVIVIKTADGTVVENKEENGVKNKKVEKSLGGRSIEQLRQDLQALVFPPPAEVGSPVLAPGGWVCDVFETYLIYEREGKTFRQDFTMDEAGKLSLVGEPVAVARRVVYYSTEKDAKAHDAELKGMDTTCSRKLASLRRRAGDDMTAELDALEAEMEKLGEDDAEGWKALNGKLNAALAKLKGGGDEGEGETVPEKKAMTPDSVFVCEDCKHKVNVPARGVAPKECPKCGGKMGSMKKESESVIKVVQPPPSVKVLFAPLDAGEVARVAEAAATKAVRRRLGKLS